MPQHLAALGIAAAAPLCHIFYRIAPDKMLALLTPRLGCIVERHIVDGDLVAVTHLPALDRSRLTGHRVRVLPYSTFRTQLE